MKTNPKQLAKVLGIAAALSSSSAFNVRGVNNNSEENSKTSTTNIQAHSFIFTTTGKLSRFDFVENFDWIGGAWWDAGNSKLVVAPKGQEKQIEWNEQGYITVPINPSLQKTMTANLPINIPSPANTNLFYSWAAKLPTQNEVLILWDIKNSRIILEGDRTRPLKLNKKRRLEIPMTQEMLRVMKTYERWGREMD